MATAKQDNQVIVTFKRPWGRYTRNDTAGFEPERAQQLIDRKIAAPIGKHKEASKASGPAAGAQKSAAKGTEGADKT